MALALDRSFPGIQARQVGACDQEPEPARITSPTTFPAIPSCRPADPRRVGPDGRHPGRRGERLSEKVVLAKIVWARVQPGVPGRRDDDLRRGSCVLRPEGASVQGRVYGLPAGAIWNGPPGPPEAEAEIFFAHLDKSRSQQIFGDHNFVFSGELKHMLGLAKFSSKEELPKEG